MSLTDPKTSSTVTINYVIMSTLNRLKDYSLRHYSFLEQVIIECFTDLNLYHLNNIEVVYLRMSEAKTVDLPCDYVDFCKIGIPIGGKIRILTRNKDILLPRKFIDGEDVGNTDGTETIPSILYFADHFRNGQFVGGLYGFPGGIDEGYFDIDKERRQIIFYGNIPRAEIVLEYISSGVSVGGSTIIPREAVPVLRQYAIWQLIENDPKVPANEKERKKQQYEEELEKLRNFQTAFTIDEYKRRIWRSTRQTIKR